LLGAGLGIAAAFLFDPNRGPQRRAAAREKFVNGRRLLSEASGRTWEKLTKKAKGIFLGVTANLRLNDWDDEIVTERVRSRVGRVVRHPRALRVSARNGRIVLMGPILKGDLESVLHVACQVKGVQMIDNQMEIYDESGEVPGLQESKRRSRQMERRLSPWSPSVRFLVATVGFSMIINGFKKRWITLPVALAGLGLMLRGVYNLPVGRFLSQFLRPIPSN